MNRFCRFAACSLLSLIAVWAIHPAFAQDPPPGEQPPPEQPRQEPPPAEERPADPEAQRPVDAAPPVPPENVPDPQMEKPADPNQPALNVPRRPTFHPDGQPAAGVQMPNVPPPTPGAPAVPHPYVAMELSRDGQTLGRIVIELFPDTAPQTVANFLQYVDSGFYSNTIFHRMLPDYVIQGGGYTALDQAKKEGVRPAIPNEAQPTQRHLRGTIAAARLHRDVNSATSQFFINLSDNRRLDRHSYAVFGKVVEGMDVIDRMVEQTQLVSSPIEPAFQTRPTNPPQLTKASRLPSDYKPPAEPAAPITTATPATGAPQNATGAPVPIDKPASIAPVETPGQDAANPKVTTKAERPRPNRRPRPTTPAPPTPEEQVQPEGATPPEGENAEQPPRTSRAGRALPGGPGQPIEKPKGESRKAPPKSRPDRS